MRLPIACVYKDKALFPDGVLTYLTTRQSTSKGGTLI